jgi:opacity protein-like surface antigen
VRIAARPPRPVRALIACALLGLLAACGLTRAEAPAPTASSFRQLPVDEKSVEVSDVSAAEAGPDGWVRFVRPYVWLPRISGSLTVNGVRSRVLVTQGELVRDLKAAGSLGFEASKGDHFVRLDTVGFTIAGDENIRGVPDGRVEHRATLALAELDAGVRVLDDGAQIVDVFTGLRYLYIKARINPKNVGVQGQSSSSDWVDPVVGTRYRRALSDRWSMLLHADYGGFGIGNASKSDYQLFGLLIYEVGDRWQIGTGWRYLTAEHAQGSGTDRQEQHLRFSGPMLGASYRF